METTIDMTLETPTRPGTADAPTAHAEAIGRGPSHVQGLRCRACGRAEALGPSFICPACFGPLEIVYDLSLIHHLTLPTICSV
jgi:threonine synthase